MLVVPGGRFLAGGLVDTTTYYLLLPPTTSKLITNKLCLLVTKILVVSGR